MYPIGRYSDDTLALQKALVLNGFDVGKDGTDGKMGTDTIRAVVDAREAYGLDRPTEPRIDIPLLVALGVRSKPTPPAPKPSPLKDWLISLAIKQGVSHIKGLPQMDFLSGYKTYILAALILISSAAETLIPGLDIPGYSMGLGEAIMVALALVTGRGGAKADVNKALGK